MFNFLRKFADKISLFDYIPRLSEIRNYIVNNRWKSLGIILLAALLTIFYVDNVFQINSLHNEIRKLSQEKEIMRMDRDRSRAEIIRLRSADRIIPLAKQKLNMTEPESAPEIIEKD